MTDVIQRSMAAGEISPGLWARADQVKYQTGLRVCKNFFVKKQGGVSNRAGTRFVGELVDSSVRGVLIDFVYSRLGNQAYVLEMGAGTMRVIRAKGYLTVSSSDATPYSAASSYSVGDLVSYGGLFYYCKSAVTGMSPPNTSYWYELPGNVYEIPTPYTESDLLGLYWAQSADVMTVVSENHPPMDVKRYGDLKWTIENTPFTIQQAAPTGLAIVSGSAGSVAHYVVTAINSGNYEESVRSASSLSLASETGAFSWDPADGAGAYNVYKKKTASDGWGYIGTTSGTGFTDRTITPDFAKSPPLERAPFAATGDYPAVVGYYQQRRVFARTINKPETIEASKSGAFTNFSKSVPSVADDATTFTMSGQQVNRVVAMVTLRRMVVLTDSAEILIEGDSSGVLRPGEVNPVVQSENGAAAVRPIIIGNSIIYVQSMGSAVRDLGYDLSVDGYQGGEVSVFSSHLMSRDQIIRWSYSRTPYSVIWAVTESGRLLSVTYDKSHQVAGWAKHSSEASAVFEDSVSIPEDGEYVTYFQVKRTINGVVRRYVEAMESRAKMDSSEVAAPDMVNDAFFVDCGLTYDGNNVDESHTMEVTGGLDWTHEESLNLESSAAYFSSSHVGNQIVAAGVRFTISSVVDQYNATVRANKTVPGELRATPVWEWGMAVDVISGLSHLEGESLAILGDGHVIFNGLDEPRCVVSGGCAVLPEPCVVVHAGLPVDYEIETLDIDLPDNRTMLNKPSLIQQVDMVVEQSRGCFAGPDRSNLYELKQREDEGYDSPVAITTDVVRIPCSCTYGLGGRVVVKQRDPLPLTINAVIPVGYIGGGSGR